MGEKGTGKTAHAVFLVNNSSEDTRYHINFLREAGYEKFVALKNQRHLALSDYPEIWKPILYLLLAEHIRKTEPTILPRFIVFRGLGQAIDAFYNHAFAPEILNSIRFVENSAVSAEILAKFSPLTAKVGSSESVKLEFSESKFQLNLLYIQRRFEDALGSLKLERSHVLFLDGIDIRPSSIDYEDYLACIKGLANAVWSINNDFFANIKDSRGRMRVVLLLRPDIFDSLGLQNQNTKLQNNAIILDWLTTYKACRTSDLFKVTDRILRTQQPQAQQLSEGAAWDHYFPYGSWDPRTRHSSDESFVDFLRLSLYRPRDILTMLSFLKRIFIQRGRPIEAVFKANDVKGSEFLNLYSNYLLGEIKDQLSFYYSRADYETFRDFFDYLNGKAIFSYEEFADAYDHLIGKLEAEKQPRPAFLKTRLTLLQFLYELNVLSYRERAEDGPDRDLFIHWCFRERSITNPSPQVKSGFEYSIHDGLLKALRLGKRVR